MSRIVTWEDMQGIAEQLDLPAMPEKKMIKRVRTQWEELEEMSQVMGQYGALVPVSFASKLLNVSRVRVYQLIEGGILRTWDFHGQKLVCQKDLKTWYDLERKNGAPGKDPSTREKMETAWAA